MRSSSYTQNSEEIKTKEIKSAYLQGFVSAIWDRTATVKETTKSTGTLVIVLSGTIGIDNIGSNLK